MRNAKVRGEKVLVTELLVLSYFWLLSLGRNLLQYPAIYIYNPIYKTLKIPTLLVYHTQNKMIFCSTFPPFHPIFGKIIVYFGAMRNVRNKPLADVTQ